MLTPLAYTEVLFLPMQVLRTCMEVKEINML
jgi:hypothetical protein